MAPLRAEIEFLEVMRVLLDLIGEQVSVFVSFPGDAGGASFTAELFEVAPTLKDRPAVLLRFVDEVALVDLDPERMTAYRVVGHTGETWWFDFDVERHRVLSIQPATDEDSST